MSTKKIFYIVRHGQTVMNAARVMQGRSNSRLNETGRSQAMAARDAVAKLGIHITRVISSPLDRAFDTAAIVSGFSKEDIETDDRLMEIDFGENEGGSIEAAMADESNPLFKRPHEYFPKVGESYYDLVERLGGFIKDLRQLDLEQQAENEGVLIATHGAAIHAIEMVIMDIKMEDFWINPVNNCAVYKMVLGEDGDEYKRIFKGFTRKEQ